MVIQNTEFEALLDNARLGDRDAVNQLFQVIREDLQLGPAKLPQWLRSRADQSDLVQDTIFLLFQRLDQFRGESLPEFLEWGRESHKHLTANYRRDQKALKRDATREVRDENNGEQPLTHRLPADQSTPSQQTIRAEYESLRKQEIANLPAQQREVMTQRDLGHGPSEIAKILQMTPGQVAGLLKRGRETIDAILSKHELDIHQ